ncbi:hypothetical protein HPB50_015656 [Hyalomma asiaticum]|uniref:Uncharacterized protein n=1 Tax=Hyalomma asiaticum TaxID=266040 RepID=A0ACB7TL93_HYAAI|nr:hypothetical protein HPB50_015656 [Hyalomma asiaticum]
MLGAVHLSSAWQQVHARAIANCFAQAGISRAASLPEAETNEFTDSEELFQEVIKLTALCEQDVPVTRELTDTEINQTATNGWDGGDDGADKPPRELPQEVPTSAERRNLLRLLQNKVECRGGHDRLMRCIKQQEDGFLGLTLCEQDVTVSRELMDTENIQTATNGWDGGDDRDDKPPQEVECSSEEDRLMRCIKQLEDAFLEAII